VGGDRVDRTEDRLRAADPAGLGQASEIDSGQREGVSTAEAQRIKELEREVKELRRANEILKLASAFFAQAELDRRLK
jgi:transposase